MIRKPGGTRTQRVSQIYLVLMMAVAALVAAGCGGSGGGGPAAQEPGTVGVTVTDALGEPVGGARVKLVSWGPPEHSVESDTGATGRTTISNVSPGGVTVYAWDGAQGAPGTQFGQVSEAKLPAKGHVDLAVTVRPADGPILGVTTSALATSALEPNGVAADGRSLEFLVRLLYKNWAPDAVVVRDCEPNPSNDAPVHQADCVAGPPGFDAGYVPDGIPRAVTVLERRPPAVLSVALLVDQSNHISVKDPWGERLFAIKYFLTTLGSADRVVLAAFASNAGASGELSLLPQQPVTFLATAGPSFTPFDPAMFTTIDSLATMEGGAAPLYAAIDRVLDFTVANAPAGGRRVVVVLTDGSDNTCGSPSQCRAARHALIDKSRALGVEILTIGLTSDGDHAQRAALGELADGGAGPVLWVADARRLGTVFGGLRAILNGSVGIYETRFRIQSSTYGVFQSGRTVLGTVDLTYCEWDCEDEIHFAVRIP